ncbi:hypothetical protein G3A39_44060 [Paraburkholderia aspalathi]|nr:hypothetical protein [Paraburkholderia aspalathi]
MNEKHQRRLKIFHIKQQTGWVYTDFCKIIGTTTETVKAYLKGAQTLEFSRILKTKPELTHQYITDNLEESANLIAEATLTDITDTTDHLKKYLSQTKPTVNLERNVPPQRVIDILEKALVNFHWQLIADCAVVDKENPLTREEFDRDANNRFNGRLLVASESADPDIFIFEVNGRPRRIGTDNITPRFGHILYYPNGPLEDNREAVLDAAWERYCRLVEDSHSLDDIIHRRDLLRRLMGALGLSSIDLAKMTSRVPETVRHWLAAKPTDPKKKYDPSAPVELVEALATFGSICATEAVSRADGDTHFSMKPREFFKENGAQSLSEYTVAWQHSKSKL